MFADDILAIQWRRQPANHFPSAQLDCEPRMGGYNDVEYEIMPRRYSVSQKKGRERNFTLSADALQN